MYMKTTQQIIRALATRCAVSAFAALWRRSAFLATLVLGAAGIVSTAHAALLVYEPFEYTAGQTLNGLSGGADAIGMVGTWTASSNGNAGVYATTNGFMTIAPGSALNAGPDWKGTVSSVPQKGIYVGSPNDHASPHNGNDPDHMWASRPLDPSVTATFTLGATTWMSCVQAHNFHNNGNYCGMTFTIGQGVFTGATTGDISSARGAVVWGGPALGLGLRSIWNTAADKYFIPGVWVNNQGSGNFQENNPTGATGVRAVPSNPSTSLTSGWPPVICVVKIVWGDVSTPTSVTVGIFPDGATLTESAFNSLPNLQTDSAIVDPSVFTNMSLGGARFNVDELRIGTTFNDVIGVVAAAYGSFWGPTNQGGTGTWDSSTLDWATAPNTLGTLAASPTAALSFGPNSGTVTVNGTVSAAAGLNFTTGGYTLVAGAPSPQISLAGADATANTITTAAGTTTNGVALAGNTGMTKAGAGTLVLSGNNTYSGGTVLSGGTLQITGATSFGVGNVDFEGGTLQYPPGSGASSLDVSNKIPTVASGKAAVIDTNGNDVTFGTAIGGTGGLTKTGTGSLTLNAAAPGGVTTVNAGTLNVTSASGTIATLNVPAGGTLNIGAGAVITTLNVTGGTVNVTGSGAQVTTLLALAGTIDASAHALAIGTSADLAGMTVTLTAGSPFTLSGANLVAPTSSNHTTITANGSTLGFVASGSDAAIGISAPGANAIAATTTFGGNGVWTMTGGSATDLANSYGKDNHAFHYLPIPLGDFDIKAHVTGTTNAKAGLMVRNTLAGSPAPSPLPANPLPYSPGGIGNWIGIWNTVADSAVDGNQAPQQIIATGATPYLEIKRVGSVITTYYSSDGVTYTQAQQKDFSLSNSGWGAITYVGLDLTNTNGGTGNGAFDQVNFMGTASMPDLLSTDLVLTSGAQMNLAYSGAMRIGTLTIDSTLQTGGTYGSSSASPPAGTVDNTHFAGIGLMVTGKLTPPIVWSDPAPLNVGTPLSTTQLNATCWVPGTLTYAPPTGTVLAVGSHTLHVDFTPTDTTSYNPASKDVTIVVNGVPFASWITAYLPNPGDPNAAPNADPDSDGLGNAIEYVLGSSPLLSNAGGLTSTEDGGNLVVTFQRAVGSKNPDTKVYFEVATTLGASAVWTPYVVGDDTASSALEVTVGAAVGGYETVTLTIPRAPDVQKFARLRVTVTAAP